MDLEQGVLRWRGFGQIFVVIFLALGLVVGSYLVQRQQIFKSWADDQPAGFNVSSSKLGMLVDQYSNMDEAKFHNALILAKEGGTEIVSVGYLMWNQTEPRIGEYNWTGLENTFNVLSREKQRLNLKVAADIGGILFLESGNLSLPSGLEFKRFNDPQFVNLYKNMIGSFLNTYGQYVDYLLLHSEGADKYFTEQYPERLNDYCDLMYQAVRHIKQKAPHIKVGVGNDSKTNPEIVKCLNKETDFYSFLLYPTFEEGHDGLLDPKEVETIIERLVKLASPKKIALQDFGYPSSKLIGLSEKKQVEFIQAFFKALKKHQDQIEYASWGMLYDADSKIFRKAFEEAFPDAPKDSLAGLAESVATMGLLNLDGRPKKGWEEWKIQASMYQNWDKNKGP